MAENQGIYLNNIVFNDATRVELRRDSIILLTGPNNCGKSQALRDIANFAILNKIRTVCTSVQGQLLGTILDIVKDLQRNQFLKQQNLWLEETSRQCNGHVGLFLTAAFANPHLYRPILRGFITHLDTLSRLISLGPPSEGMNSVVIQQFALLPLNDFYENLDIARKIYGHIKSTFGRGVMMNHSGYLDTNLYFINLEHEASDLDPNTSAYARWFESKAKVVDQGDGVNSFTSIIATIMQQQTPLILLDEPEAFLHPPQIRELARIVAAELSRDTQLIIATHSDDFVRGMIEFASDRTTVLRMRRMFQDKLEINRISRLDPEEISQLWNDPLLRTSDLLSALFHKVSIIVEGDSDARFFRSMIESVLEDEQRGLDFRFFHCGGKDKIPKVLAALIAINIDVFCIVDIDILSEKSKFEQLVRSLGKEFAPYEANIKIIQDYVNQKQVSVSAMEIKSQVISIFDRISDQTKQLCNDDIKQLGDCIKRPSVWSLAKQNGDRFFNGGQPYNAFRDVCALAFSDGIIINSFGELENFCRRFSPKRKAEWLSDVLTLDLKADQELEDARHFARKILTKCAALVA